MIVQTICEILEDFAPLSLQESYDNCGLQVGNLQMEISSVLICIDVTEAVVEEALNKKCNLIVSHHPLIFGGLKKIVGSNEVQRCVQLAIKNDIAIYSAHTNADNVLEGVSGYMAKLLKLKNQKVLQAKASSLLKLVVFVPNEQAGLLRQTLFQAGAGDIGEYDSCSYNLSGTGTFRAGNNANPFVGKINEYHSEPETRIEVVLPVYNKPKVLSALLKNHPYEEPAYDFYLLQNEWERAGLGIVGDLDKPIKELDFLHLLKQVFKADGIRHTKLLGKEIQRVALCGGAGSEFLGKAITCNADVYISGDFKYHDFFLADNNILVADIGHFESEQFTKELFCEVITKKIPTFAVQISEINTNPINYL